MQPAPENAGSVRPSRIAQKRDGFQEHPRTMTGSRGRTLFRCTRAENTEYRPARAIINQCLHIRHRISDMFPRPLGRPTLGSMGRVGGGSKCVCHSAQVCSTILQTSPHRPFGCSSLNPSPPSATIPALGVLYANSFSPLVWTQ